MSQATTNPLSILDAAGRLPPAKSNIDIYGGYSPSYPPTAAQKRGTEEETKRQVEEMGIDGWSAAMSFQPTAWMVRQFERSQVAFDPDYKLTDEKLKEATFGVDPAHWPDLADANSDAELQIIREQLMGRQTAGEKLASMGWAGTALQLGASLFDPATYAIAAGTGGLGEAVGLGGIAGRAGSLVRGGFVGASTGIAIESYMATQDRTRGLDDVLYMGATGLVLGGGLGAFSRGLTPEQIATSRAANRLRRGIEYADLQKATGSQTPELTPKGQAHFREQLNPDNVPSSAATIDDHVFAVAAQMERDLAGHGKVTVTAEPSGMGAASPSTIDVPQESPRESTRTYDYSGISTAKGWTAKVGGKEIPMSGGIGMTDMLVQSPTPDVRRLGRMLGEEVVPNAAGEPVTAPTSMEVARFHEVRMNRIMDGLKSPFEAWAAERGGMNIVNRGEYQRVFMEEVTRAQAMKKGAYTDNPHINGAADSLRAEYAKMLKQGKDNIVKGYKDIPESDTYVPRVRSKAKINENVAKFGPDAIHGFVSRALNDRGTLTPKLRESLSRAWLNVSERAYTELQAGRMFAGDMGEVLRQALIDAGTDEQAIADIMHAVGVPKGEANLHANAEHRIDFNEAHVETLTALDGTSHTLRFRDLLENDAIKLANHYSRQLEGAAAMSEVYRAMSPVEGPRIESLTGLLAAAERAGATKAELGKIDTLARHTLGLRAEPGTGENIAAVLQTTRKLQHLRLGGSFVFNQIADIAGSIAESGFKAILDAMPDLRAAITEIRTNGRVRNSQLLNEYRAVGALGTSAERGSILNYIDHATGAMEETAGKVRNLLDRGIRVQSKLTLLEPVIEFMQKATVVLAEHTWANIAKSGKLPSKIRLAAMGLAREDAEAIVGQVGKHATYDGSRLVNMGLDKWDPAVRAKYAIALDKFGRRNAMTPDIGQMSQWMTTEWGKSLIQFRTFNVAALSKMFRFNLRMADARAGMGVGISMLIGTAAYIAREHAASIGRADRQKYLDRKLAPDQIAKVAFSRSGFFSLFPPIVDTIGSYSGLYSPQFSGVRSTGLEQDPIFGNPTLDFFNQARAIPKALIAPVQRKYQFSQEDLRAIRQITPFQNAMIVRNWFDAISTRLPSRSKQR